MSPKQEEILREVHIAIIGNEKIGVDGLVKEVRNLKLESENNKAIKYKFIGAGAVLAFIGSGLVTWLLKYF